MLITVTGPSGVGKSTIVEQYNHPIAYTTRNCRTDENPYSYYFVDNMPGHISYAEHITYDNCEYAISKLEMSLCLSKGTTVCIVGLEGLAQISEFCETNDIQHTTVYLQDSQLVDPRHEIDNSYQRKLKTACQFTMGRDELRTMLQEKQVPPYQMSTLHYYQAISRTTAIYPQTVANSYPLVGLCGEVGEVADLVKKSLMRGTDADKSKLQDELGDVLWYLSQLATENGISLHDVAHGNIVKVHNRLANNQICK